MPENEEGGTLSETPPSLWEQAEQWHKDLGRAHYEAGGYSSCFCCCEGCDPDWDGGNPFYRAALDEAATRGGDSTTSL